MAIDRVFLRQALFFVGPALVWGISFKAFQFVADFHNCTVNDAGPHPCFVGGADIGGSMYDAGTLLEYGLILVVIYYPVYFVISMIRAILS